MSDELKTLQETLGEDDELVSLKVPDYMKGFDQGEFELVQMPSPQEMVKRVHQAAQNTENPVESEQDWLSSMMIGAETDSDPKRIQAAIGAYKETLGGGTTEGLFSGTGKRLLNGIKRNVAVFSILNHMATQDPVAFAKAQALMTDLPADDVLWEELPDKLKAEYMTRALDDLMALPPEVREDETARQKFAEMVGEGKLRRRAVRLFKIDNAIPTKQYGPIRDVVFAAADTFPQIAIGGLLSLVGAVPGMLLKNEKIGKAGAQIVGRTWMSAVETAYNYWDLVNEGYTDPETGEVTKFDPTIAAITSTIFGVFQGQVEFMEWEALGAPLSKFMQSAGYQKATSAAIRRGMEDGSLKRLMASIMKRQGKAFAGRYAGEVMEEVIQGISSWVNREAAVELNNRIKGTEFEHQDWKNLLQQSLETAGQAAKGFLLLQLGSSLYGGATMYQAGKKLTLAPRVAPEGPAGAEAALAAGDLAQLVASGQMDKVTLAMAEGAPVAAEGKEAAAEEKPAEKPAEAAPVEPAKEEPPAPTEKVRRVVDGQEYEFDEPPALERGILAVRLKSGPIVSDPGAALWLDVADHHGLNYGDVVEIGRVVNGIYMPEDAFNEWVNAGADEMQLPHTAIERFKEAVRKQDTSLNDFQVEGAAEMLEARARSIGLSSEEYLHGTFQHEIATNQAPPDGSLQQLEGSELEKFNQNAVGIFGEWKPGDTPAEAGWILSNGTIIKKGGGEASHRMGVIPAYGIPELGYIQRLEEMGTKGAAIRYNDDFKAAQAFGKPTEAQLRALDALVSGQEKVMMEITDERGDVVAFKEFERPDYNDLRRWFGRSTPRAFFQGTPSEYDMRRMGQKAINLFGITHDPMESGYILPDGTMLDLSGRNIDDDYEKAPDGTWRLKPGVDIEDTLKGKRGIDHDHFMGRGDDKNPLGLRQINSPEFVRRSGAMRVDARGQYASFMKPPTAAQVRALANAMTAGYAANMRRPGTIATNGMYVDVWDEKGQAWASYEIARPTVEKLQRVFSNLQPGVQSYRQVGPVYHGGGVNFPRFETGFIGSGQGATSFGWGLYFTSVEQVARDYAEMSGKGPDEWKASGITEKGEAFSYGQDDLGFNLRLAMNRWADGDWSNKDLERILLSEIAKSKQLLRRVEDGIRRKEAALERIGRDPQEDYDHKTMLVERGVLSVEVEAASKILGAVKNNPESLKWEFPKRRNLYTVTLHKGKQPSEYTWLDWYGPVPAETWDKVEKQAKIEGVSIIRPDDVGDVEQMKTFLAKRIQQASEWLKAHQKEVHAMNVYFPNIVGGEADQVIFDSTKMAADGLRELRDQTPKGTPEYKKLADWVVEIGEHDWVFDNTRARIERAQRPEWNGGVALYRQLQTYYNDKARGKGQAEAEWAGKKDASLFLLRAGVDGVVYPIGSLQTGNRSYEAGRNYVVFDDRAITIDKHILYQRQPNWRLRSREIIQDKMSGPMPGEQILKMLKNNGVKDDEMKWIGLEEYLTSPEVKMTLLRQEGLSEENARALLAGKKTMRQVVKETLEVHEAPNRSVRSDVLGLTEELEEYESHRSAIVAAEEQAHERLEAILRQSEKFTPQQVLEWIADHNVELRERQLRTYETGEITGEERARVEPPKFQQYTLAGGTNYREILFQWANVVKWVLEKNGNIEGYLEGTPTEADRALAKERGFKVVQVRVPGNEFESTHYPGVPNLLVHARVTDRVGPNGEKILFVEEVQSDLHQRGREKGYKGEPVGDYSVEPETVTLVREGKGTQATRWRVREPGGNSPPNLYATEAEAKEAARMLADRWRVPPAPFSKTWHEVVMKRLLQEATEGGYDTLAWTTGQQQIDRYPGLEKMVAAVAWSQEAERLYILPNAKDATTWRAVGQPGDATTPASVPLANLPRYVGKELADRMLSEGAREENPVDSGEVLILRGDDLKVGGQGQRGFYDKILVDFMNKYGKKWGASVGESRIGIKSLLLVKGQWWHGRYGPFPSFAEGQRAMDQLEPERVEADNPLVHSVEITPEMRDAIQQGQYLWMRGKGAVSFADDGRALLHLCEFTDASTVIHELGHIWRRQLHAADVVVLERFLGVKDHEWDEEAEEKFANMTEQYVRENVIPAPELRALYGHFRNWLKDIYERFGQFHFTEPVKQVFDGLFIMPKERVARQLMAPIAEGEADRILNTIMGAVQAGSSVSGKGLNLAEIRSLSATETRGVNRGKAETAEERGGAASAGEELRRAGKSLDYLRKQIEKNPTRWRVIERRFSMYEVEKAGMIEREDIAEYEFAEQVAAAYASKKDIEAVVREIMGMSQEELEKQGKGGIVWFDPEYKGTEAEPQPNGSVRIGPAMFKYTKTQQIKMLRDALTTARREARMQSRLAQTQEREKFQKRWKEHKQREQINKRLDQLRAVKASDKYKRLAEDLRAPIDRVLDLIDLKTKKGFRESIAAMAEWFGREENKNTVELPDRARIELDKMEGSLRSVTPAQVEALYQYVMHYLHLASEAQWVEVQEKRQELDDAVSQALKEMGPIEEQAMKVITSSNTHLEDAKQKAKDYFDTFLGIGQDHYDLIVQKLSGVNSTADKLFVRAIEQGRNTALTYEQGVADRFQQGVQEILGAEVNFGHWLEEEAEIEGSKIPIKLTRGERMALYMHSKNEDNWASITEAGFGFRHRPGWRNKIIKPGKHYTVEDMQGIVEGLNEEERAVCDLVAQILEDQGREIAPLFLEVNGYEFPQIENYWHKDTMPIGRGSAAEEEGIRQLASGSVMRPGVPKGFLKERLGVQVPLYLNSIAYDLFQSVTRTAAYLGFEKPLRQASRVLNNRDFKTGLIERYGERVYNEIRKGLCDVAGEQYAMQDFDKGMMRLRRNMQTVILGFKLLFTPFKQPLQLANAAVYIKPDFLWHGIVQAYSHPKAIEALHKMFSPKFRDRVEIGFTRDIAEFNRMKAARRFVRAGLTWKQASFWALRFMDTRVVCAVMMGAVDQVLTELEAGKVSDEVAEALELGTLDLSKLSADDRMKMAYQYADFVVARSQDTALPEHRSPLSRGGPMARFATIFGSSTNANWNILKRMMVEARMKKTIAAYGRLMLALLSVLVVQPVAEAGLDTLRDIIHRRERKEKDFLWKVILSISGMWYFVRDVTRFVVQDVHYGWGADIDLLPTQVFELAGKTISNGIKLLTKNDQRAKIRAARGFVENALDLLMIIGEIPLYGPKHLLQDLMKEARVWPYRIE